MTRIDVLPSREECYLHDKPGFLAMYIGKVTDVGGTRTVVPCRGITDDQLQKLKRLPAADPQRWHQNTDGSWTTHASVRVDVETR